MFSENEYMHIVHESHATHYEINVNKINNPSSDYDGQYVVSLVNFGECFFESDLNHIAEAIFKSSKVFSSTDAVNIQNAIARTIEFDWVREVEFEYNTRMIKFVEKEKI